MKTAMKTKISAKALIAAGAIALASAVTFPAQADTAREATRIVTTLSPTSMSSSGSKVEHITINRNGRRTTLSVDYGRSLDLTVFFPYDSAEITGKAEEQLNTLGLALMSHKLRPYRFLIGGHTDAAGTDAYNLQLSLRRAIAVRDYLITKFDIAAHRLVVAGWGERRLKDRRNPEDSANRRVEVALVVSNIAVKSFCPVGTVLDDIRDPHMDLDDFGKGLTKPHCVLKKSRRSATMARYRFD